MIEFYVGVDWATEAHQICVLDDARKVIDERSVLHSGEGLTKWIDELLKLVGGDATKVAVAIETPRSAVVEMLMERGVSVYSLNPKQLDRFRDRHTVAGAKDDRRDAFVLADSLRTDRNAFRLVRLGSAELVQLRELVRIHDELVTEVRIWGSRAREQLLRYFPQLLKLGSIYTDSWMWDLLDEAPTPATARHVTRAKIASILKKNHVRRVSPDDVLAALRAPALRVAPGVAEAAVMHFKMLLPRLRLAHRDNLDCLREIEKLLETLEAPDENKTEHRDAFILSTWPGLGIVTRATMLAEAWQPLEARDYNALRTLSGSAPVTKQSGKRWTVSMRRACNSRLSQAMHQWALASIRFEERSKRHYAQLRARGHTPGRALRGVADRLLAALVASLRDNAPYDPARRECRAA